MHGSVQYELYISTHKLHPCSVDHRTRGAQLRVKVYADQSIETKMGHGEEDHITETNMRGMTFATKILVS